MLWISHFYSAPGRGVEYCDQPVCVCVCLSASISLEPLDRSSRNFVCRSPVAMAWSSSGSVAVRYVLPVIWMTSRLAVMGATPEKVGSTQLRRSITCATGAESDVYECLFVFCSLWLSWIRWCPTFTLFCLYDIPPLRCPTFTMFHICDVLPSLCPTLLVVNILKQNLSIMPVIGLEKSANSVQPGACLNPS